jgi:hypothetical protein
VIQFIYYETAQTTEVLSCPIVTYDCDGEQMQGLCLFPFTLEKQNALLSVLEPLMVAEGNGNVLQIEKVRELRSVIWWIALPSFLDELVFFL